MYWRAKKGVDERVRHYFAARLRKRSVFRKRLARKKEPVRRFSARWSNVMHEKLGRRERNSPRHEKSLSLSPFCDRPYSTVSRFHRSGEALNPTRARFNWSTNKASPSADPPDQYRTYEVVSSFDIAAQLLFLAGKTLINTRSPSISNEGETRYREETRDTTETLCLSTRRIDLLLWWDETLASRNRRRIKTQFASLPRTNNSPRFFWQVKRRSKKRFVWRGECLFSFDKS